MTQLETVGCQRTNNSATVPATSIEEEKTYLRVVSNTKIETDSPMNVNKTVRSIQVDETDIVIKVDDALDMLVGLI